MLVATSGSIFHETSRTTGRSLSLSKELPILGATVTYTKIKKKWLLCNAVLSGIYNL